MVLVELGSGIDALYLSGRCHWSPVDFLDRLDRAREEAEIAGVEVPISVGDAEFRLQAHGLADIATSSPTSMGRWASPHP